MIVKHEKLTGNKLNVLAGAFAGHKRKGERAKTAAIAEFIRGKNTIERLAFSIKVAEKLNRGAGMDGAVKRLNRHISGQEFVLDTVYEIDRRNMLAHTAYVHGMPYFPPDSIYIDSLEGKMRVYSDPDKEFASSLVEWVAKNDLAHLTGTRKREIQAIAKRAGELL